MRGVRKLEDGRVIIADGFGGAVIVWTPGVGADTLTKLQGDRRSIGRRTASSPCLMAARSSVDLGNARLTRIEVDLSFGETWSIAQGAPGTGLAMISPWARTARAGSISGSGWGDDGDVRIGSTTPPQFPLFDPVFPLFEHDRPDHGLTARTADRAVPVELRRFLPVNHIFCTATDKQERATRMMLE